MLLTMLASAPDGQLLISRPGGRRPRVKQQADGGPIQQLLIERGALMTLNRHSGPDEFLMSVIVASVRPAHISCLSDTRKRDKSEVFRQSGNIRSVVLMLHCPPP